jgi:hypothetical protein
MSGEYGEIFGARANRLRPSRPLFPSFASVSSRPRAAFWSALWTEYNLKRWGKAEMGGYRVWEEGRNPVIPGLFKQNYFASYTWLCVSFQALHSSKTRVKTFFCFFAFTLCFPDTTALANTTFLPTCHWRRRAFCPHKPLFHTGSHSTSVLRPSPSSPL